MGYNISKLPTEEISNIFIDKIYDYKDILETIMDNDEYSRRLEIASRNMGTTLTNYNTLKKQIEEGKGNERDKSSFIELENYLQILINDEMEFLKFMVSAHNGNVDDYGLRFQNENGEIMFDNVNRAIAYSVITNVLAIKDKKKEEYEMPKFIEERLNNPMKYIMSFDEVSVDLPKLFGDDLYKCFFTGDGVDFYYLMTKYFNEDEIRLFDKAVTIENDNYHEIYHNLIVLANNKKNQKQRSIS